MKLSQIYLYEVSFIVEQLIIRNMNNTSEIIPLYKSFCDISYKVEINCLGGLVYGYYFTVIIQFHESCP